MLRAFGRGVFLNPIMWLSYRLMFAYIQALCRNLGCAFITYSSEVNPYQCLAAVRQKLWHSPHPRTQHRDLF